MEETGSDLVDKVVTKLWIETGEQLLTHHGNA